LEDQSEYRQLLLQAAKLLTRATAFNDRIVNIAYRIQYHTVADRSPTSQTRRQLASSYPGRSYCAFDTGSPFSQAVTSLEVDS
jgi:hypothetical protein